MNHTLCEQLDDYLLGELAGARLADFERHFAVCKACRLAAEEQSAIDGLLREASRAIPLPPELKPRVHAILKRNQQRTRTAAVTAMIAAASVAMLLAGLMLVGGNPPDEPGVKRNIVRLKTPAAGPGPQPKPAAAAPRVRVELPRNVIALPVESGDPNVTLIQVFPVVTTKADTP